MRHPSTIRRGVTAASAAATVIALLAGCGAGSIDDDERDGTLYLVTTATANEPAPTLPATAAPLLETAAKSRRGVAQILMPSNSQVAPQGTAIAVTVMRGDSIEQDPIEMARGLDEVASTINESLAELASGQQMLDLLTGLDGAARLSPRSTIIAISSGVQTSGLADLAGLGWDFDPEQVAADLAEQGFVPDLTDKSVYFAGLGDVAGDQAPLPAPARAALEDLWLEICRAGGAKSCQLLPGNPGQKASADRTSGVKTVPVRVFSLPPLPAGAATIDWSLDSDTLFAPNSAALRPGAKSSIGDLATQIRDRRAGVEITGHTWRVGPADTARQLAQQRAQAVAEMLISHGVPAASISSVRGVGYDEPVTPVPGQDEAAANRVVTMRVTTS